jgi:Replication-relaxation
VTPRTQHITELRRDILEALDKYIFLTILQAFQVLPARGKGTEDTRVRALKRALHLLEDAGYVTHCPMYEEKRNTRSGFATRRFVYYMTRKGAEKLAAQRVKLTSAGIQIPKVPNYQRKPASLAHEAAITEFHISLEEAFQRHQYLKLHWFQKGIRKTTNPDAIFGIQDTRKPREKSTVWFFLEMEMSRAGNWKYGHDQKVRKLKRYEEYRRRGDVKRDWAFIADFRVIFHEETNGRMLNLLKKLEPLLPHRFIWLTSTELVREKGVLARVFYTPRDFKERSISILDLLI